MNAKLHTVAALIAIAAGFSAPAFAQEATPDHFDAIQSTASREAVRADAIAAAKAGLIERGEASVDHGTFVSVKTRAQVTAEAREAVRLGVVGFGEGPAPRVTPAQAESIRMAGLRALSSTLAAN